MNKTNNMKQTKQKFEVNGWEGSQGGIYSTLLLHALIDATNPSLSHETYPQTKNEDLLSVLDTRWQRDRWEILTKVLHHVKSECRHLQFD